MIEKMYFSVTQQIMCLSDYVYKNSLVILEHNYRMTRSTLSFLFYIGTIKTILRKPGICEQMLHFLYF